MKPDVIPGSAQSRRARATLFYRRLAERDMDAVAGMLAADVLVHSPVVGRGKDLAFEAAKRCFAPSGNVPAQPEPCFAVADGTTVTTCFAMPQTQPDGSTVDFFWMDTVRIEDDLVVEWWPSINDVAPTQVSWVPCAPARQLAPADGYDRDEAKNLAVGFYRYVFDSQDASAVARFVTDDYLQHSRHMPSGLVGLEALVSSLFPDGPRTTPDPMTLTPTVLVADRDIVVHGVTLSQRTGSADTAAVYPYIVYDAYRVREGKIAEHWSGVNPAAPPVHGDPSPGHGEGAVVP